MAAVVSQCTDSMGYEKYSGSISYLAEKLVHGDFHHVVIATGAGVSTAAGIPVTRISLNFVLSLIYEGFP